MTDLPRALAPWAPVLGIFPRDVALALGPWVQRLALALGPLEARVSRGDGEPDGFDGLARRGPYERLLVTEWLLHDEAPDEFARRAVMGEHGFLRIARRAPAAARTSVALFDAGPSQLGGPRLLHLAALVALARRAAAAGARFAWGVLQRETPALLAEVNPQTVMSLLGARTAAEVDAAHLDAHREALAAARADDVWVVAAPRVASLLRPPFASRLEVWDPHEPGVREVCARVHHRGRPSAALGFGLPDDAVCARLIRDPFEVRVAPVQHTTGHLAGASSLLFSPNGRKLYARVNGTSLAVVPVPNSPNATTGRIRYVGLTPRHRALSDVIAAAGSQDGRPLLATVGDAGVHVDAPGAQPDREHAPLFPARPPSGLATVRADGPLWAMPWLRKDASDEGSYFVVDGAGELLECSPNGAPPVRRDGFHVAALAVTSFGTTHFAFVGRSTSYNKLGSLRLGSGGSAVATVGAVTAWQVVVVHANGLRVVTNLAASEGGDFRAFFGFSRKAAWGGPGLVGVRTQPAGWTLLVNDERYKIGDPDPARGRVVGVATDPKTNDDPALLVLREDGRSVELAGLAGARHLFTAPGPVAHVTASHAGPVVACAMRDGSLLLFSIRHERPLARYAAEAAP